MIEAYTRRNKRFSKFNTDDVAAVVRRLKQLNIISVIKYLIVTSYDRLCTYFCTDCHKRTYFNYSDLHRTDVICDYCKQDNKLFFIGFKQSEKQVKFKYAV